jgi:hypothetical protein
MGVGQGKRHHHAKFAGDVALYDGVVEVADDAELRVGRRHEHHPGFSNIGAVQRSWISCQPAGKPGPSNSTLK